MDKQTRRAVLQGLAAGMVASAGAARAQEAATAKPAGPAPKAWTDAKTGYRITRLSPDEGGNKLYFYKNSFTPQGDLMVFSTPSGIMSVELKTGRLRMLVADPTADLLFTARRSRDVFYSVSDAGEAQPMDRPRTIFAISADGGKARRIGRIPNGQINAANADDSLMLGFVAYGSQPLQPGVRDPRNRKFDQAEYAATGPDGKPLNFARAKGVRMLERWAARYPMEIFTLDLATGERRVIHKTNEWIGHTQFSPTDPKRIIFSHEGPWHRVDRMWTMRTDGSDLRKLHQRTMNFEIFGHEWFSPDGREVHYDLQTPRGQVFWVASVDLATGARRWRRVERDDWSVHFNSAPDGRMFAGDGGDADMVAHAPDGKWIVLLRPEAVPDADPESDKADLIATEVMRSTRLVDMSAHDYRLEPNVTFTPDGRSLIFCSNMHGRNHVYAVDLTSKA
jgi:oligogalacturonide lyase